MKTNIILQGDALTKLKELQEKSINMCMTSPPYFNQRDYGVEGQLGLEKTPEEYVNNLCNIFDEVKRVLRDDGTCWVNISDCYGGFQGKNSGYPDRKHEKADIPQIKRDPKTAKSLLCVPEMFLLEMVKRGWLIRNKIIWFKNNVMPSSASDRFTIDFEMLYFFVKQKKYYFEQQFEPFINGSDVGYRKELRKGKRYDLKEPYKNNTPYAVQPRDKEFVEYRHLPDINEFSKYINDKRKELSMTIEYIEEYFGNQAPHHWFSSESFPSSLDYMKLKILLELDDRYTKSMKEVFTKSSEKTSSPEGRNKRTVWNINTKPSKVKHFAVYPEELCETPIKAGCPEGGIVLDPFFGSGTTGLVALKQNKKFIGCELNLKYIEIANKRLKPFLEQTKLNSQK